jgi:hypothetical protein
VGDSVLAEFGSAVEAVQCAVEAQTALAEANARGAPAQNAQRPPSKISWARDKSGYMRTIFLAMIITVLSGSAVLADPANRRKLDYATPLDRLPPAKSAAGNPCAAFGPGFVKVEGTDTCVKVGGAFRVDVSGAAGSH